MSLRETRADVDGWKAWKKAVIWPIRRPVVAWRARKWIRKH